MLTMIQGHAFGALLAPGALGPELPRWYVLWHGLTAPMFLVGAGLAYGHVRMAERGPPRLGRPLWLLALGFYLQLPGGSLRAAMHTPAAAELSAALGPVALIGVCLAGAELARTALSPARLRAAGALVLAGLLLAAPSVWSLELSRLLPLVPGTWLDGARGSTFPIFPWAAFFVAGTLLAPVLASRAASALGALAGGLLMALAYAAYRAGIPHADRTFWHAGPLYVGFRLGACLALLGALPVLAPWPAVARALRPLARHSLVAYVVHLVLLYGSPFSRGLVRVLGPLGFDAALLPSGAVLLASYVACLVAGELAGLNLGLRARSFPFAGKPVR